MLIVQGVFRSGTSLLFQILQRDDTRTCFYEPLHPDLLTHIDDAQREHPAHRKSRFYREYVPIASAVKERFRPSFATDSAVLDAENSASDLTSYLNLLRETGERTVLQFNRAFWMSSWLKEWAPDSRFLHVVRDPRSVVWSQITTSNNRRVRIEPPIVGRKIFSFSSGDLSNVFSTHAFDGAYDVRTYRRVGSRSLNGEFATDVQKWAVDRLRATTDARPYVRALAVWAAQVAVCRSQAKQAFGDRYCCIRYEDLCTAPRRTAERISAFCDAPVSEAALDFATTSVERGRMAHWHSVAGAADRFREGVRRAGIESLVGELGYID